MNTKDELRVRQLLELIRMENNRAEQECQHGDGWLSDHAGQVRDYSAMVDEILAKEKS